MKFAILSLSAVLLSSGPVAAQVLYFGNASVEWDDVTLSGSQLTKKGAGGGSIPVTGVTRLEWPYPAELTDALELMLGEKYEDAQKAVAGVRQLHGNWRDKPGSWYITASQLAIEIHVRKGELDAGEKIYNEIKGLTMSARESQGMRMLDALMEFKKGIIGPAFQKVTTALLSTTADAALLARLHLLEGDIQSKREEYEKALDAYVQVSVFYGAQAALLPAAELGIARALRALQRFPDARAAYARVVSRHAASPQAALAIEEKGNMDKSTTAGAPVKKDP